MKPTVFNYEKYAELQAELERYKRLESDGKLVVLPCKIGDDVYFIKTAFSVVKSPIHATVSSNRGITQSGNVLFTAIISSTHSDRHFSSSDIGDIVFLTYDDAEIALERIKNETDSI